MAADHAQGADTRVENSRNYRPQGQQWTTIEGLVEEGHSNRIDMIEPGTNPKARSIYCSCTLTLLSTPCCFDTMLLTPCAARPTTLKPHTCCHPGRQRKSREQRACYSLHGTSFRYFLDYSVLQD